MGRDKAALEVAGETLAAYAARRLSAVCAEVAIADRGRGLVPGFPSLSDAAGFEGGGPAGGILGAARALPDRPLLVLACDLPNVPVALLAELMVHAADWVVPRSRHGVEPLCALYRPAALAALAAAAARGVVAPHRLDEEPTLGVHYLGRAELERFGPPDDLFLNLNTPEDLKRWLERSSGISAG